MLHARNQSNFSLKFESQQEAVKSGSTSYRAVVMKWQARLFLIVVQELSHPLCVNSFFVFITNIRSCSR